MDFDESAFEALIAPVGLKHITYKDLLARITWKNKFGTRNSPPPQRLWGNIIPTAIVVDAVAEHYGKSVKLHSIYRSEAYNQASKDKATGYTGRAPTSQHIAFSAIDFTVSGRSCTDVAALLKTWANTGRKFHSPVFFQRAPATVKDGKKPVPFGELPWEFAWGLPSFGSFSGPMMLPNGINFMLKGYVGAYPSDNFTHVDTRGAATDMKE